MSVPPSAAPGDAPAAEPGEGRATSLSWPARALAAAGWAVVAIGALGAADRISHFAFAIPWMSLAAWMLYVTLVHDLLIAPVVTLVALGVARLRPRAVRGPVAGGLIVSASLVAISVPRLWGAGALADNPSVLPGHAPTDLAVVLAGVWLTVAVVAAVRLARTRPAPA